jgi:hypothetical protein
MKISLDWAYTIAAYGFQIGDGRSFQHRSLFGELNFL